MRLMGWFYLLALGGIGASIAIPALHRHESPPVEGLALIAAILAVAAFYLFVGAKIKRYRKWAKVTGVVLALLALFVAFPVGTLLGALILYYLWRGWNEPAVA